jgi:hypothetical protein
MRNLIEDRQVKTLAAILRAGMAKVLRDQSGQAAMFGVVCLMTVMGVMALAVDVGNLRFQQQRLQTVADTAAMAGALEVSACGSTSNCSAMQSAAKSAVVEDGLPTPTVVTQCGSSSASGVILQVNNGPCALGTGDPNNANTKFVEAVVTQKQGTFFGAILHLSQITVAARSEATTSGSSAGGACLLANSIAFNSAGTLSMTCGIQDNGNLQTNNGDKVTTPSFNLSGSWGPNNCNGSCVFSDASPTTGATKETDPLASLKAPTQPATSTTNTGTPNNGVTLQPGYYPNGFNLNSNVSVKLAPGLYYMGGAINVNNGASLTGTGVEMYFASGSLQPNSGSTVQLTAPTTTSASAGTTAGMLDWQSATNSTGMNLDSGSSSFMQGVVYLPAATLTLNSGSGVTVNAGAAYTALDVNGLMINSNETFKVGNDYSSLPGGSSPLGGGGATSAALAE